MAPENQKEYLLNVDTVENFVKSKAEVFVEKLNGRFNKHVSDKFIIVYLMNEYDDIFREYPSNLASGIAYKSAVKLFEVFLEGGCKVMCNGHHVAQDFASYFEHVPLKEMIENERRKSME